MFNDRAELIAETYAQDAMGITTTTETKRAVFVKTESISQSEWYRAGEQGLNPAIKLITPEENYKGEKLCEYSGKRYAIYRTYRSRGHVELYLQMESGVTNG